MTLTAGNICWRGDQPWTPDFDDIYHSADGIAESLRVFIEPAGVCALAKSQQHLCVAELGFGTGLNFALCAREVLSRSDAHLHFVSFEKHPLRQADWRKVIDHRVATLPIYLELDVQPLPVMPGWHRRIMAGGRINLSVFHGDVGCGLADFVCRQSNPVDAWFLDGFAPAKNPSMWTPAIYCQLAQIARSNTTVSTFSAAGHVRRGLQTAGFNMRRIDQRPHKRESLAGYYTGKTDRRRRTPPAMVAIHGAGIGGASMARHLAEQRIPVQVYDPKGIAGGASRMDAAVMHSRLLADDSADAEMRASAFHYASTYVRRFAGVAMTGVLQTQGPNLDQLKLERICQAYDVRHFDGGHHSDQDYWIRHVDETAARTISATNISGDALLYATAGTVDLPVLCASLLDHPLIEVVSGAGPCVAEQCTIICSGVDARLVGGCERLEVTEVHGQLDWFATRSLATLPVIGTGYLIPTANGCALGATYEHTPWTADQATRHNLKMNAHHLAHAGLTAADLLWQRRTRGTRAVTSDRIPIIGKFRGLWMATAFGSMGTTTAPLAAAMVSSELSGWLPPVSPRVQAIARPERFEQRQARRGIRQLQ